MIRSNMSQVSGKNLGMIGHFSRLCAKIIARSTIFEMRRQPRKFENPTLVVCQGQHFRVFGMIFLMFLFSLKQSVWS